MIIIFVSIDVHNDDFALVKKGVKFGFHCFR